MDPILAIIDVDIHANHDELARERLLANLSAYHDPAVRTLWVNRLRMRADIRVVCLVDNLHCLDDFIIDVIRSVPGVRGTTARLGLDGLVRGDVLDTIPLQDSIWTRRASATVDIHVEPGRDCDVYEALCQLPGHNEVEIGYVLKCLHGGDCDMIVLLLGQRTASLSGFVMSWIRTIPGVTDTTVASTLDWKVLASTEDLVRLAQSFPEPLRPA